MPDLSHLWQRFVLAAALLFGLALGVGATVFAYSNTAQVTVGWSVFHLGRVPLWTVVLVPIALVLVAGTVFHWLNSLHHFTEHMRHRHRVRELEAELTSVKSRLDALLEMPDHTDEAKPKPVAQPEPEPAAASSEAVASNGEDKTTKKTEPVAVASDSAKESKATSEPTAEA